MRQFGLLALFSGHTDDRHRHQHTHTNGEREREQRALESGNRESLGEQRAKRVKAKGDRTRSKKETKKRDAPAPKTRKSLKFEVLYLKTMEE